MADLCQTDCIKWIDGSQSEYYELCESLVASGTFVKLNQEPWPNCFYAGSTATDVARVEDRTFICSLSKDNAGPTNNWEDRFAMRRKLKQLFVDAWPYHVCSRIQHGPVGSPMSQIGVQLTDSAYAVVNMRIMSRVGAPVLAEIDRASNASFPPSIRSAPAVSMQTRSTIHVRVKPAIAAVVFLCSLASRKILAQQPFKVQHRWTIGGDGSWD